VLQTGGDFNPEAGFLNRAGGYRYYELQAMRFLRKPAWPWFRVWNPHVTYRGYYGLDGSYQSGQVHLDLTEFEFTNGTRGGPEANVYHEGLLAPFTIAPGVTIPAGQYDWTAIGLDLTTNPSADLSLLLRGDFGPFYRGTRNGGTATLTLRRGASLSSSLLVDYQDVHLPEGNFVRSLVGTRIAWFFTPRVFVQTLAQFNNQQRVWSMNTRFGWLSTAGTGLFVVFNDGEEADGFFQWRRPLARSLTVKFTRQVGIGG